jgi:hypothetical protein
VTKWKIREARCLLIEKLIKAVVTLPLNTLQSRTVVNSVQERRRRPTEVVLLEGIRYLKVVGVSQVVTTMVDQMAHMGSQAWITYPHMLQDATINARSGGHR